MRTLGAKLGVLAVGCCVGLLAACGSPSESNGADTGTGGAGSGGDLGDDKDFPDPDAPSEGCGTLDEAGARSVVLTNVESVLRRSLDAVRFAEGSKALARVLGGGESGELEFTADTDEQIDDLVTQLDERLLTHDNFESAEGSTVTFKMNPDVVCPPTADELENDPEGAAADETECRDSLAQHDVRVRVQRVDCDKGDNVVLTVEVSEEPLVPLVVNIRPNELSLALDVKDTALTYERLGKFDEGVVLDQDLSGRIGVTLGVPGEGLTSFGLSVLENLVFGAQNADESTRITADEAPALLTVDADSSAKTILGKVSAQHGSFEMWLGDFLTSFFDRDPVEGLAQSERVKLALPGLVGSAAYDGASDAVTVTGLGLLGAPFTVRYGQATLLSIDWNAAAGRLLDFVIQPSGDDVTLGLGESGLNLSIDYAMSPVASKAIDLPAFTLDDTLTIQAEQSSPLLFEDPSPDVEDLIITSSQEGALLRMNGGSLTLSSSSFPAANVTVAPNQCLLRDGAATGEHAFLSTLSAGACP